MKDQDRKAAIASCKKRRSVGGVYAVRCLASGEAWVGQSPNLDTIQNRIWFSLGVGGNPNLGLQKAWGDHGAQSFAFEIVERLAEDEAPCGRDALLKERVDYWRSKLAAAAI